MKDQYSFLAWNCRGASSNAFFKNGNQYVRKYKPNMLVIMETSCDPSKSTKSFNRMGYDDIVLVVNESFVGGIVVPDW